MKKTKVLAWLMTLVMMIGLLPATVLADDVSDEGNGPAVEELQQETDLSKVNLLSEDIEEDIKDDIEDDDVTDVDLEEDQDLAPLAEEEEPASVEALYVSADGNDDNSGTKDEPLATLAKAVLKAEDGATIYIMSDLTMTKSARYYDKNLTITSTDDGPFTITRGEEFQSTSDNARSWYNPAMIEVQTTKQSASLVVKNLILDDAKIACFEPKQNFTKQFTQQDTKGAEGDGLNLNRVQSAIIESTATYPATVTLGKGAVLQNYGGMSAVRVTQESEVIMESGSSIIGGGKGQGAIWCQSADATMEDGSEITGMTGSNAIMASGSESDHAIVTINGEIKENNFSHALQTGGYTDTIIGKTGYAHDNDVNYGTIYLNGNNDTLKFYGRVNNNTSSDRAGGIALSNNGTNKNAVMYEGAEVIGNVTKKEGAGGLLVSCGTFTMEGGTISKNEAVVHAQAVGGGVHVRRGGSFIMNGGEISNNKASVAGGGIAYEAHYYGSLDPNLQLNGGTIADNTQNDGDFNDVAVIKTTADANKTGNKGYGYVDSNYVNNGATLSDERVFYTNGNFYLVTPDETKQGNASKNGVDALAAAAEGFGWGAPLATFWRSSDGAKMTASGITLDAELPVYVLEIPADENGKADGDVKAYKATVSEDKINFTLPGCGTNGTVVALVQPTTDYGKLTIEVNPTVLYEDKDAETYTLKYTATFEISDNLASLIDQGALSVKDLQFVPDLDEELTPGTVSEPVYDETAKTLTWTFDATMAAEDFEEGDSILTSGAVTAKTDDLTILVPGNVAETTLEGARYKEVTFKVVNGTWSNDGSTEKKITVTLGNDGTAKISEADVPMGIANKGFKSTGVWDKDPTKAVLSGTDPVIYTLTFEKANSGGGNSKPSKDPIVAGDVEEILNTEDHFQYVQGYPDGTVGPERNITRAEVTVIFFRLLQDHVRENLMTAENNFPDVNLRDWFNVGVSTMESGGFVSGYDDGTFKPNAYITRAELATIISNFDDLEPAKENKFADCEGHWAEKYINSAAEKGWLSGYDDGLYRPNQYITRAETMSMINRVLNRRVDANGLHKDAKQWSDNPESKWYYYAVLEATNHHDYQRADVKDMENWTAINPNKGWEN